MSTSKKVEFQGHDGQLLSGRLELPDGTPRAIAVFAHCFTCSKDIAAASRIGRALSRRGVLVLRFDFTGLGNSEGDFSNTHFSSNVQDIVRAMEFLEQQVQAPKLLIGHSLGGAAVVHAARLMPDLHGLVSIGAPSEPAHVAHLFSSSLSDIQKNGSAQVSLGGREFTIRKSFLDDLETTSSAPVGELNCAKLIFHSPLDETVGIENARKLYEQLKHPKSFVSLEDADHLLSRREDSEYVAEVLSAWVSRYLPPPPPDKKPIAEEGEVTVRGEAGTFRTQIFAGDHSWTADEPKSVGGTNRGPTPYDMLLAGLGACTSMTLHMYASRKKIPLESVQVQLSHGREHAKDSEGNNLGPLDRIVRSVKLVGSLDEAQRSRLAQIADRCPVHRTLENTPVVETSVTLADSDKR